MSSTLDRGGRKLFGSKAGKDIILILSDVIHNLNAMTTVATKNNVIVLFRFPFYNNLINLEDNDEIYT